ncbi:MAG: U32 family peptidase, partial [Clostridia bacterium]|nr:U32 family peptidase [Clostridia bacterium]
MKRNLHELLSPAGSPEALRAALLAGAAAVSLGGTLFNARMNARNFDRPAIIKAVKDCHERGVRLYVTQNTLVVDRQMKDALEFAGFLYEAGVDALIVADLGLALEIKKRFPDFPLHASTQMSGHNVKAAEFLKELGFERMVCARELSGENIRTLCKSSPIEIEAFVHGALCVSHSGQCLFSSIVGGRSGNRGECAQPCRLPYNGKYPLSLKDNCLAGHVKELIDMGVASLKIEGRMKSPEYVYSVVSAYRGLLDEQRDATAEEIRRLADVFSRDGFTDGYF